MVLSAYLCPALEYDTVLCYDTGGAMGMVEGVQVKDKRGITDILFGAQRRKSGKEKKSYFT